MRNLFVIGNRFDLAAQYKTDSTILETNLSANYSILHNMRHMYQKQ